ncbi:crotonase/enoyl-CoA hydratase family protein [Fulvivirgaceae bacterium BMA12]|uniref:Crotonase/enoyl-CoA hydratase family protein n=1 Tax=Agaribacillus aureus TaxID=3051825 RepID=A0ABT8L591_9BACT|nr:crotonase/enoyl-CoA hydratase family protein [Fulvivirgaceae bacterium BMA12]
MSLIDIKKQDNILLIGLNRPEKMNAFTSDMLKSLSMAYGQLEEDPALRCGLVYANGKNFTAGLELNEVGPKVQNGENLFPAGGLDPLQLFGAQRSKPVVTAVQGYCLTIAIELILANDICVAARDCQFGQIEIKRGIFPFGGATIRFVERCGWGNAMRYLLTGDLFDAEEARRIGLIQEIAEDPFQKALEIAKTIAAQAPLAVQATLLNARKAKSEGFEAAKNDLYPTLMRLMQSDDAREGVQSFVERRKARFEGK